MSSARMRTIFGGGSVAGQLVEKVQRESERARREVRYRMVGSIKDGLGVPLSETKFSDCSMRHRGATRKGSGVDCGYCFSNGRTPPQSTPDPTLKVGRGVNDSRPTQEGRQIL